MIYIEKNDKPNIIEKMLNLIKVQDSTIILPINEKTKEKQIEKIAKKTIKVIGKISNSKKIVLSKKMKKEENFLTLLKMTRAKFSKGLLFLKNLIAGRL